MTIYISGALKGSNDLEKARSLYERAGTVIRRCGHLPYIPHQNTDPLRAAEIKPISVFNIDIAQMRSADGVIAFLNEPSLGVGAELAICAAESIPVLAVYERAREVSRFVLGLLEASGCTIIEYDNWSDLDGSIAMFLDKLKSRTTAKQFARSR